MYFNWKYTLCLKHIHLLATMLGIPCYYPFGLLLTFRTTFIFLWHRFKRFITVQETFLSNSGSYCITQMLPICWLRMIWIFPKGLCWIKIWWLLRSFKYRTHYHVQETSFLLEGVIRKCVHCGHKRMDISPETSKIKSWLLSRTPMRQFDVHLLFSYFLFNFKSCFLFCFFFLLFRFSSSTEQSSSRLMRRHRRRRRKPKASNMDRVRTLLDVKDNKLTKVT